MNETQLLPSEVHSEETSSTHSKAPNWKYTPEPLPKKHTQEMGPYPCSVISRHFQGVQPVEHRGSHI